VMILCVVCSVCFCQDSCIVEDCVDDILFFFFFQAEDGIRDWSVTGVQTCALPIYRLAWGGPVRAFGDLVERNRAEGLLLNDPHRSEERRVGKECRSRWSPDH